MASTISETTQDSGDTAVSGTGLQFTALVAQTGDETHATDPVTRLTCSCPVCSGIRTSGEDSAQAVPDRSGIAQLDEQGFLLDPSHPASGLVGTLLGGLPVWSAYETAMHIARPYGSWANWNPDLKVTYSFGVGATLPSGYEAFGDPASQAGALLAMQMYADISGLTFAEVADPADADITYMFSIGSTNGGGWAHLPSSGGGQVTVGHVSWEPTMAAGTYALNLLLHELGHGLGLNHPGYYNGDSAVYADSDHYNDSAQYTNMSYWSGSHTGASFSQLSTPGLHDILAIQIEYGINWSTRSGNTTYGFNSTAGSNSYDFGFDRTMGFSIWDGGGNDTLDFSGFTGSTVMDLRQGSFSSTGLETYNVSVAYGAVIENAVGGSGDDRMRGNEVANHLSGGLGNDILYGGAETPVATVVDPRHFTGISLNHDPVVRNQFLSLTNVQALSGSAFTVEMMVDLTRSSPTLTPFLSYAVSGGSNELLIEGANDGYLKITIDNQSSYSTPILLRRLIDGEPHRLSVSWDSASGAVAFYIDGQLAHAGIYTASIGRTLTAGGTLVFGQEQDSLGGGFSSTEVLSGSIGDIRIFTDLRSAQEIAEHAFTRLSGNEQGLAHNWQVQAGDTVTVTDVATANPAIELTALMHGGLLPAGTFVASQSSSYDSTSGAERVIDDSTTTFNHTRNTGDEWLRVDFAQPLQLSHLEIVNRSGQLARLNGATVSVLDAQGAVLYTSAAVSGSPSVFTVMLPGLMTASAVRIDQDTNFLHISDLNIYGHPPAGTAVPPALLNTDLSIQGGATVVDTTPLVNTAPDNDTLAGGAGNDTLRGGAGNDTLIGDGGTLGHAATLGLALNGAGGNSQSLRLNGVSGLPSTAFTLEYVLDSSAAGSYQWFGNLPGISALLDGSNLWYQINGNYLWSGISVSKIGSDPHRISFTWDSATGAYAHYFDGVLQRSGTGFLTGATLNGGGSGDVVFNPVNGALGDIRLYTRALTANEITATSGGPLSDPAGAAGLKLNWVVNADGSVSDARGGSAPQVVASNGAAPATTLLYAATPYDDLLDGGLGADTMTGGRGDDTYIVDNTGDRIVELAGEGTDTIVSSVSFTASAHVENLSLTGSAHVNGTGNTLDNRLTGNAGNNVLDGGAGSDTLLGGAGNDTLQGGVGADSMSGGLGDDRYYVDNAGDTITELAGEGLDTVYAVNLASLSLGDHLERLYLQGSSVEGIGNALDNGLGGTASANVLHGMDGHDYLSGEAGDDTLLGGAGNDTLQGGAGNDTLLGGAGNDTYLFGRSSGTDLIQDLDGTAGNADRLLFSSGISTEQLWFEQIESDLRVSIIGTSDSLTVDDWYLGAQYRIEQFRTSNGKTLLAGNVDVLVNAMAGFTIPGSGQTTLTSELQAALAPTLATAWA